jgi:hypothetical protein
MNFVSGSRWENFIFGPTAVVLAVLCFLVATGAQNGGPAHDTKPMMRPAPFDGTS